MNKKHKKILLNFIKVIEQRDTNLIGKALYYHLYQNMGFIAHYDIHGFRAYYNDNNFVEFLNEIKNDYFYSISHASEEYRELNLAMQNYILDNYESILFKLENERHNKEIEVMLQLAEKHGYTLEKPLMKIEKNGQLTLF